MKTINFCRDLFSIIQNNELKQIKSEPTILIETDTIIDHIKKCPYCQNELKKIMNLVKSNPLIIMKGLL